MKQKLYVLVEMSSGEVPTELDNLQVFTNRDDAVKQMKKSYKALTRNLKKYGCIEDCDINDEEYSVEYYDDNCRTTYYGGYVREKEVE